MNCFSLQFECGYVRLSLLWLNGFDVVSPLVASTTSIPLSMLHLAQSFLFHSNEWPIPMAHSISDASFSAYHFLSLFCFLWLGCPRICCKLSIWLRKCDRVKRFEDCWQNKIKSRIKCASQCQSQLKLYVSPTNADWIFVQRILFAMRWFHLNGQKPSKIKTQYH